MTATYGLGAPGMVSALGNDPKITAQRLFSGQADRLSPHTLKTTGADVLIGQVHEPLPELPGDLQRYNCRNHRLGYAAYLQVADQIKDAVARYGAHRVGVVVGSSTAGLDTTEQAYAHWRKEGSLPQEYDFKKQHAMGSVASVIAGAAGVTGPAYTISTACTSSAKALISARDLLAAGFCDVVITGGVDTLCELTLNGFEALGALSRKQCLPMSANRSGLNIGEAAVLFLMTRDAATVNFIGGGESSDAHHMTAPHPEGEGAELAMRAALKDAGLAPDDISYLNLHGTATPQNDAMEAKAVARVFDGVPCSSTKPFTGHCLGAAGAIEAAFCMLALSEERPPLPPHIFDGQPDPDIPVPAQAQVGQQLYDGRDIYFMSNSFAFGGNNCALIFGRRA